MLHVVFKADEFLLNITTIDEKRRFLNNAVLINRCAQPFLQARF